MKIYTKVGDNGGTSLYDGSKVSKDNIIIDCIGDIDELNCEIGCVLSSIKDIGYHGDIEIYNVIIKLQSYLFNLGALIAHPNNPDKKNLKFDENGLLVKELEDSIDNMTAIIPKLSNFILPGGSLSMSFIHKSRTVCRRVERKMVNLKNNEINIEPCCLIYINRLSDFLFTFARYIGHIYDVPEVIFNKNLYN